MSTPRCIRLAIRSCKPSKISRPVIGHQTRFLASSYHQRAASKVDIKAGFPETPMLEEDANPQTLHQDISDTSPRRRPSSAATSKRGSRSKTERPQNPLLGNETAGGDAGAAMKSVSGHELHNQQEPMIANQPSPEQVEAHMGEQPKNQSLQQPQSPSSPSQQLNTKKQKPQSDQANTAKAETTATSPPSQAESRPRLPLNVVAAYHKPLRHSPALGIRVASLQLRSYSIRNLEIQCDFALRAAYFLGLPASGPVALPKKIERWTMPRSNFVHKKSQENFERITRRRLIQIFDGHKDVVQLWLAFLRKHQFYGVGMKADVWEFEGMDVAASMDVQFQEVEKELDEKLSLFGWNKEVAGSQSLTGQLRDMGPGQQTGVSMMHLRERSRSESRL